MTKAEDSMAPGGRAAASAHPQPWTREQIDAWIHHYDHAAYLSARAQRQLRISRSMIVRLCPEAADYDDLGRKLSAVEINGVTTKWRETATTEEIVAHETAKVAALWARSLSEPGAGEASELPDEWAPRDGGGTA